MLVMGDECRRTQRGNNNAYCQDNEISLVRLAVRSNRELVRLQALIKFRRPSQRSGKSNFLTADRTAGLASGRRLFDNHGQAVHWTAAPPR